MTNIDIDIENIINTNSPEKAFNLLLEKLNNHTIDPILKTTIGYLKRIIELTEKTQCAITVPISPEELMEITNPKDSEKDHETKLFEFYLSNNSQYLNEVINQSKKYSFLKAKIDYYDDAYNAFINKSYYSACVALFTICDYLLTTITSIDTTNLKKRFRILQEYIENNEHFCLLTFSPFKVIPTFFTDAHFQNEVETSNLNRHWILHGRTNRKFTQYDCIKLFCLIHALLKIGYLMNSQKS